MKVNQVFSENSESKPDKFKTKLSKENKMKALDRNVVSKKEMMPQKPKKFSENVETEEDFALGRFYSDFSTNCNDYLFQTTEENSQDSLIADKQDQSLLKSSEQLTQEFENFQLEDCLEEEQLECLEEEQLECREEEPLTCKE